MKAKERAGWEAILAGTDYQLAARTLVDRFSGGVLKKDLASLFDAFLGQPCLETALAIIEHEPLFVVFFKEARSGGVLQVQESARANNRSRGATRATPLEGSIEQYASTVVDAIMENAETLAATFKRMGHERNLFGRERRLHENAIFGFAFLTWAIANGVWSNLERPALRQTLMALTLRETAYRLALKAPESSRSAIFADKADSVYLDLVALTRRQIARARGLEDQGYRPNSNAVMLFVLEWLQGQCDITDASMDSFVREFLSLVGDYAKIERLAIEVVWAARESDA